MTLKELTQDTECLEALKRFTEEHLEALCVERVMARGETAGIANAKEILDATFEALEVAFAPRAKKINLDNAR